MKKFDFSGWATRNDLKCSDGRTIRRDAFKDCDGMKVPLVWNHQHNDPENVLGHALLENRKDGVYAYCYFNNNQRGREVKEAVRHGDISSLSIYANQLKQRGQDVIHGMIREVSLVLAGANPGAYIEDIGFAHSDDPNEDYEANIYTGGGLFISHSDDDYDYYDDDEGEDEMPEEMDLEDVLDSMTPEQLEIVQTLAEGYDLDDDDIDIDEYDDEEEFYDDEEEFYDDEIDEDMEDYDDYDVDDEEDYEDVKHNLFDDDDVYMDQSACLTHADQMDIIEDARRGGSLKESFLAHAASYGIDNIDYLFPDARNLNREPDFISRKMGWVSKVMSGVHHTPFSRIKSMHANITEDEARAKGYIKGKMKKEEVFSLLKRSTGPTTIYKKQKIDRDDQLDITDFDVIAWLKREMRMMLDEELARAFLIGDGRLNSSDDKIKEDCIRPIWTDADLYSIKKAIEVKNTDTEEDKAKKFIKEVIRSRKEYKGSGNPVLYTTEDLLTSCLLIEDGIGRRIYNSVKDLATALRVSDIVTVEVMENKSRKTDANKEMALMGIIVNLADYTVGADKGGEVNMFDDFDIDFNQNKYLIETRCSGALTKPYSAIVMEYEKPTTGTGTGTGTGTETN